MAKLYLAFFIFLLGNVSGWLAIKWWYQIESTDQLKTAVKHAELESKKKDARIENLNKLAEEHIYAKEKAQASADRLQQQIEKQIDKNDYTKNWASSRHPL